MNININKFADKFQQILLIISWIIIGICIGMFVGGWLTFTYFIK
jgi:TRAP-type C4-dicarboxylate transport system permease small subunit